MTNIENLKHKASEAPPRWTITTSAFTNSPA